jgi:hypothetical protein
MKTKIKITATAVITVLMLSTLLALGCAPEVELTKPDFAARNESFDAEYTDKTPGNITINNTPLNPPTLLYGTATSEEAKEIRFTFPANADILKETNANMTAKLKEFLSIYTYSNPPVAPVVYTPSDKVADVGYTFAYRVSDRIITIKLDSVPNSNWIVCKIDASKYKVRGQLVDFNRDGIGGESYDDQYLTSFISSSTTPMTGYTTFYRPEQTIDFSINGAISSLGGGFYAAAPAQFVTLYTSDIDNDEQYKRILSDIAPNIKIQKYNQAGKTWSDEATAMVYTHGETLPANAPIGFSTTNDQLYVTFSAEDMGIYRLKASGMANLVSKDNYGSKPAKIRLNFDGASTFTALKDTFYSEAKAYYNSTIRQAWETTNPVREVVVKRDAGKKNVVLEVYFNGVMDNNASIPGFAYLKTLTVNDFNGSVKLVYRKNGLLLNNGAQFDNITDLVELKVDAVEYKIDNRSDAGHDKKDCIVITLDPAYQIAGNREISLLLSPGFEYEGGHITFGQYTNIERTYYNGTFFWRSYGSLLVNL